MHVEQGGELKRDNYFEIARNVEIAHLSDQKIIEKIHTSISKIKEEKKRYLSRDCKLK